MMNSKEEHWKLVCLDTFIKTSTMTQESFFEQVDWFLFMLFIVP